MPEAAVQRVLVVGGGIAGGVLSLGLAQRGVEVVLVDLRDGLGGVGHGITLQGNALKAFQAVGIYDRLAERGYLGVGWSHLAVVGGLAVVAALLSYATQRFLVAPNTVLGDVPDAIARIHQMLPALSAAGLLVAGGAVPVALLVYWVCNSIWTLGQSAVIRRWFPAPA